MFRFVLTMLCLVCVGIPAHAEDENNLRKLLSPSDARAWQAVGLLQMDNRATCTGTLIAPNQVLTAAHCVFDPVSKKKFEAEQIEFYTGWRLGRAASYRTGRRVVVHKDYRNAEYDGRSRRDLVAADLALIELDRDVDTNVAIPFGVHLQPRIGQDLTIVSYAQGRNEAPSIEEGCKVLDRDPRVLMASCSVDYGASGSPIFTIIDGTPLIASVVSAKGEAAGRDVSFGVALGAPLDELRAQLQFDRSVFQAKKRGKSLAEQLGR